MKGFRIKIEINGIFKDKFDFLNYVDEKLKSTFASPVDVIEELPEELTRIAIDVVKEQLKAGYTEEIEINRAIMKAFDERGIPPYLALIAITYRNWLKVHAKAEIDMEPYTYTGTKKMAQLLECECGRKFWEDEGVAAPDGHLFCSPDCVDDWMTRAAGD